MEGDSERFTIPELVEANGFTWEIDKKKIDYQLSYKLDRHYRYLLSKRDRNL